jgi:putative YhdH/YhfP family quinone oxidoreductase
MDTFQAYLIEGSPARTTARFAPLQDADLDPGAVTLRVAYASINYKDALAATGKGPIIKRFPCVGGIDAVGTVEASTDARFKPGDSVIAHSHGFGVSQHGGYAQRARAPADWVSHVPEGLSPLEAITIGVAGYTAALALDLCELNGMRPDRGKVLVNGATGGVASVAIDLLAQRGFHVVAATRKLDETTYLKSLGAADVVDAATLAIGDRPLERAEWQGAIDSLGGEPLSALTRTTRKDGVIASIGNAAGLAFTTSVMPFILRGVRLIGVNSDNEPDLRARLWRRLATDLRPKHLAAVANVQPFTALPKLLEAVVGGRIRGRTIIELPRRETP